jgi:tetratricopeptide (TPR) repeat protein
MSDYYDLGTYTRKVTTTSDDAQRWFDRGLNWCYGFNHEEAIVCFEKALGHDPACAMAHWGLAYAIGPNYNKPWVAFDEVDKRESLERARSSTQAALSNAANASAVEKAIIGTLCERYPENGDPKNQSSWDDAYASAMRDVYAAHPDDLDVRALFAEALMNRTPWALWDLSTGEIAEGADTLEARDVLESAFSDLDARGANVHPGLLHMYLHLMEMSPHPERALKAGDALRNLVPDAGHLRHMPTHIDVLCGHYKAVVDSNSNAIVADRKFLERSGPINFYSAYRCHDYHFKIYGAMFLGQYQPAIEAAEEMISTLPDDLLTVGSPPMADWLEGFVPMKQHVLIRFGKWQEIVEQPLPDDADLFCVTTAMMRYARTVAFAASGDVPAAVTERDAFLAARDRVPETRMLFNNTCLDILAVAEQMLQGEVEYRRGNIEEAFAYLRRSVELDDALPYDEPWGWMQPSRHALGALLLEQGQLEEAEAVYRADLGLDASLSRACQHPDNVWSLHGLHECLVRRGEKIESTIIKQRLDLALARADVSIKSSCYCRTREAA